ncbi:transcriptional regulator [Paraburkholderia hospita]|uniref:transcriptional regulator n=1 Tax=Paraburkholderia hospita TaxID=169430 RepID=UPI003ED01AC1
MAGTWSYDRAEKHIKAKIDDVKSVVVADYVRELALENIATNKAYRVDGVHLYADIINLGDMLNSTATEGETCHKRTLRFLNLHYRAVSRILSRVDARRVDFHNQRLHSLVTKPYNTETDAEAKRVRRAVAIAQLIIDVLKETGDDEDKIPAARVRVGIDSGKSLAVNNGRNGYREPLFLGDPANHAAKLAGGGSAEGIYLTNEARRALGLPEVEEPKTTRLTRQEIEECEEAAALEVTSNEIVEEWREDLDNNPIGAFEFSRHTPPFCDIDIVKLTPKNSRRQESISIYADIDGFTRYVSDHIDDNTGDVVRVLHVVRAELERVLTSDFKGRRVRFIGDCIHGLICEGTAQTTDEKATVGNATLLAGALRSSFDLALEKLIDAGYETGNLGLSIGFEYGPMTLTRLGIHGDRVRCSVSRGVLASEAQQMRCNGVETALGLEAYEVASDAVRKLFGSTRKRKNLDYNEAVEALADKGDDTGEAAKRAAYTSTPAAPRPAERSVRPHAKG